MVDSTMASEFLIKTEDGEFYELSVSTEVKVSARNTITKHKTESKDIITDNAVVFLREISYNGLISSIKRTDQGRSLLGSLFDSPTDSNYKTPKSYLEGLDSVRTERKFITCYLANELTPIPNCLIENLEYIKDNNGGLTTWRVSFKAVEVRLTTKAASTTVPAPAIKDITSEKKDNSNATTEKDGSFANTILVEVNQGASITDTVEKLFTGGG